MPKFVSETSGHIYAPVEKNEYEEDISSLIPKDTSVKKPSKGTKERQKNSLDLFKEELRRLQEEKDEQRNKLKNSIKGDSSSTSSSKSSDWPQPVPVPLKPDPRCPTLTLQVNLNPKDRESSMGGSFDNGDPTTTNLYIGNINPTVNEFDLCDLFGKYGPLASIKIMWPRTEEQRARNRNSGFVAYMNRSNAEVALKCLNGIDLKGYNMKLGWGKAVPIPQNPVYIPPEPCEVAQKNSSTLAVGSLDRKSKDSRTKLKGTLNERKRDILEDLLRNLDPTKVKVGSLMLFCINHSDAAKEIIECIYESLRAPETPYQKKVARLLLISDILHNCSAPVTNASYYREGFQAKLVLIFENLREYLLHLDDRYQADKFKQKALSVLGAWKEWTLYEDEFIIRLSNILLGIEQPEPQKKSLGETCQLGKVATFENLESTKSQEDFDLDGEPVDDETLDKCLEAKGLSLRWYKTLELSEDEDEAESDEVGSQSEGRSRSVEDRSPSSSRSFTTKDGVNQSDQSRSITRSKTSKWETVDPNEVATGQASITISKWESALTASRGDDIDACEESGNGVGCDGGIGSGGESHNSSSSNSREPSSVLETCPPLVVKKKLKLDDNRSVPTDLN